MTGSLRRLAFASAALAAVAGLACGRGETAAPAPPEASSPPGASEPAPPAVGTGDAHPSLPADFPADVPIHPGATSIESSSVPEEGVLVSFRSQEAAQAVFDFYKTKLAEQGWTVEGEMSSSDQHMLLAGKGARKTSVLVADGEGGGTEVTLTLTEDRS